MQVSGVGFVPLLPQRGGRAAAATEAAAETGVAAKTTAAETAAAETAAAETAAAETAADTGQENVQFSGEMLEPELHLPS